MVYKARDTKLDRPVALKFLPPYLAASAEAKDRFVHEAKAASALDHPNIGYIHEINEAGEGQLFIAMAYYRGETLKEKIARGPLPIEEAVDYAMQIAEGLAKAHEAGIVHRDVKPANVMVTDEGRVKIVDFGLAKMQDVSLTRAGVALGTAAYMSPEQTRGEAVDARTDLWALGAVLYEMLTGERPFRGESAQAVIYAIRNDDPTPMDRRSDQVPAALQAIVERCLTKGPRERYQTAEELRAELRQMQQAMETNKGTIALPGPSALPQLQKWGRHPTWKRRVAVGLTGVVALLLALWAFAPGRQTRVEQLGGASPASEVRSLAVLPLVGLSEEAEQEYFAAGMTEALINRLGQMVDLTVISRTSVLRYRGTETPVRQIARELGVDAVVEGSVLRAGPRVRVTAQLVEAPTGRQLWAASYEEELRDVLALQSKMARAVATEIQVALTTDQKDRLARARPVNPKAYKAYLRGTYHLTRKRLDQGLDHLRQAVDEDPADPLAWAGLATGYVNIGHSPASTPEAFQRAKAAAMRALELDATIAEAHAALADVKLYYDWDWAGAEQAFQHAIELNPNLAEAHRHYAWLHLVLGREDVAIAAMERAHAVSPLAPLYPAELGWLYWTMGRCDEAIDEARTSLELHPDYPVGLLVLGGVRAETGLFEEAIAALEKTGPFKWARTELARTYARMGRTEDARRVLAEFDNAAPANAPLLARIHAALGEKNRALRWLDAGYASRNRNMPWIGVAPAFKSLHGEPRFQALLEKVGLQ